MGAHDLRLSRRAALAGGAGLVVSLALPLGMARGQGRPAAPRPMDPNAYVRIGTDDIVTVVVKHIEFGQGPLTGLATLVADELDADWAQVRGELAPSNAALYGNIRIGGIQGTGGSTAMAASYDLMRRAGAIARAMLVQAAAAEWGVRPADITIVRGVMTAPGGHSGRFGQFATAAARLSPPQQVTLKTPAQFSLIGKENVRRLDSAGKSNGAAVFTIDQKAPGMLTVVVARPPRFGAKVGRFDPAPALAVRGVRAVRQVSSGVAVYADGMWPALKGRQALAIAWDDSGAETRGSDEMIEAYLARSQTPGVLAASHGDVAAALADGGETVEATYVFPYLAHAPMEPLDGVLLWDGSSAVARFGCQFPGFDHPAIARVLGLPADKVTVEVLTAGGSFGRRAQGSAHLAVELAEVAKAIGPNKPVKLVWTREDDLHGGYYRPLTVHRFKGAVKDGAITAWSNTIVGQSIARGTPMEAGMIRGGIDATMVEGAKELPYAVPAFRCDAHIEDSRVTTLWWRSVGHTHTGYAVECFVDALLEKAGRDPVEGRLAMMAAQPRAAGVLRAVARLAGWNGPAAGEGRARGVAVVESFGSFVAQIAEVSLNADGSPRVHKIWCAVDCGVCVNPDIVRAQMEGGIGYAVGHALYAEVPLVAGAAAVSNFDTYRSLRIHEMPTIEVTIVASTEPPTGVGEPGVPPAGPAIANALARLKDGSRPARLPMVRA